jgi:hypothetical protein
MRMSFSRRVPVAELLGHPVYEHSQARRQLPRTLPGWEWRTVGAMLRGTGHVSLAPEDGPQSVRRRLSRDAAVIRMRLALAAALLGGAADNECIACYPLP